MKIHLLWLKCFFNIIVRNKVLKLRYVVFSAPIGPGWKGYQGSKTVCIFAILLLRQWCGKISCRTLYEAVQWPYPQAFSQAGRIIYYENSFITDKTFYKIKTKVKCYKLFSFLKITFELKISGPSLTSTYWTLAGKAIKGQKLFVFCYFAPSPMMWENTLKNIVRSCTMALPTSIQPGWKVCQG